MPSLDYEELVRAYEEGLTTVLRGFRAGPELLETWVPDPDPLRSLLGLLEAARESGEREITVTIGDRTLRALDLPHLLQRAGSLGAARTCQSDNGFELIVELRSVFGQTKERKFTAEGAEDAESQSAPSASSASSAVQLRPSFPPATAAHLWPKFQIHSFPHEASLSPEQDLILSRAEAEGVEFAALIDPVKHEVRRAAHCGSTDRIERTILETLCTIAEGKPILELSDHGMVRVIHRLLEGKRPPVPGIVTPRCAPMVFRRPAILARGLLDDYRLRSGFHNAANFYDPPVAAAWRALSSSEREARLRDAIARFSIAPGSPGAARLVRLDGLQRAIVALEPGPGGAGEAGRRLLEVERALRASVEPTLELYLEPRLDQNRLRKEKGVLA